MLERAVERKIENETVILKREEREARAIANERGELER